MVRVQAIWVEAAEPVSRLVLICGRQRVKGDAKLCRIGLGIRLECEGDRVHSVVGFGQVSVFRVLRKE